MELDRTLEAVQAELLTKTAPGVVTRPVRWSMGRTQALELGEGPPLLLFHGGFDNAFVWTSILPALAQHRRVIAVDLPGHGLADAFDYRPHDLRKLAPTFVGDVLDALELQRSDVGGMSVGGFMALAFAIEAPDRVRRLPVIGAPPGVTRDAPLPMRLMAFPLVGRHLARVMMSNPSREGTRKLLGRIAVVHPERLDDLELDADVASQRRNVGSHLSLVPSLLDARGIRPHLLIGEQLLTLSVPTLFVCGEQDAFVTPKMATAWDSIASHNPKVQIERIPGAGHRVWADRPQHVVRAVNEFLGLGHQGDG